jgi:perosamine synthetase
MNNIDTQKISINEDSTIRHAMQTIEIGELGVVFVVDENNSFIRVLTDGDIRRAILDGYGLKSSIALIEKQEPVFTTVSASPDEVSTLFNDKIRVIPVLDNNKIVDAHIYDKRTHIAVAKPLLGDEEIQLINECVVSGWVSSGGKFINEFEKIIADHCNRKYAVCCNSGTAGLHLALLASGIGPGDEVIVPSLTFIATANAVTYTGATPVFVDSEIATWNIDPDKIEQSITSKTKAIIPVHLYGHPADMDPINKLAKKYELIVIEDAAEAQGAFYKGNPVGSLADMAIFSFFGNKIITTGEGGMVVTDNEETADKCKIYRDHGMSGERRYWHDVLGYNYRMTNLQAAIGVAQMSKIDRITKLKKNIAKNYEKFLKNIPGITLPMNMNWADNIFWLYTILIEEEVFGTSAEKVMEKLKENHIDSRPVFPPMHIQPLYKNNQELPVSEFIYSNGLSLPSAPEIKDEDIKEICNLILSCH